MQAWVVGDGWVVVGGGGEWGIEWWWVGGGRDYLSPTQIAAHVAASLAPGS